MLAVCVPLLFLKTFVDVILTNAVAIAHRIAMSGGENKPGFFVLLRSAEACSCVVFFEGGRSGSVSSAVETESGSVDCAG